MISLYISFKDKNIVVTGGTGLIGGHLCKELAKSKANIFIIDTNKKSLLNLVDPLKKCYSDQIIVGEQIDISKEDEVKKIPKILNEKFGEKLHGLVNSVQYKPASFFNDIQEYTLEDWEKIFSVNVFSIFSLFKHLLPGFLKAEGSSIVNLSSTYAIVSPNPVIYKGTDMGCPAVYAASKGAVHSLTKYLACYYAKDKIRVNSVTPHGVYNEHEEAFVWNFSKLSPLGRMSKTEEVAPAIMFLLSEKSSYTTGANIKIDGGWTAW